MAEDITLSDKEEAFVQLYLIDFNGGKAAREAGYSESSCYVIAHELLRKPKIQQRIKELRDEMGKGFNITRERIAQEYARIAFFDIRKIHTVDGAIMPVNQFGDDEAAAIAGIEVDEAVIADDAGERMVVGSLKKIKVSDKRAALDSLVKLMGYAEPDKSEVKNTHKISLNIVRTNPNTQTSDASPEPAEGAE